MPPATPSLLAYFPVCVFHALLYDFLFLRSARVPGEQNQDSVTLTDGNREGNKVPSSDLVLDILVIQVNGDKQKHQLQQQSPGTSGISHTPC